MRLLFLIRIHKAQAAVKQQFKKRWNSAVENVA
jgi:hypothetical protein